MVETINRLIRTSRQLLQELGREPTPEEIAEKMGMTEIQCRVRLFRLREKLKKFEETLGNL